MLRPLSPFLLSFKQPEYEKSKLNSSHMVTTDPLKFASEIESHYAAPSSLMVLLPLFL